MDSFYADCCKGLHGILLLRCVVWFCQPFDCAQTQVKLLFTAEWKVCYQIFEGIDTIKDQCFAGATANGVAMLLSFGEAVVKSKRSPEKLFVLLDMYEIMCELQHEVQ